MNENEQLHMKIVIFKKQEAEMQLLRNDVVGTASSESEPIWPQQLIDYLDQKYGKIVNQQKDEVNEKI